MTTLSANSVRNQGNINNDKFQRIKVIASDIIYQGAAVGDNASGYARPLVAADPFYGFAERKCDNSAGAAGDKRVLVKTKGEIELSVTGVTGVGDIGSAVYADDDDTFTLTSSSNSAIGKIVDYISGTKVMVAFEGVQERSI